MKSSVIRKKIAILFLVLMVIQYIPIESEGVSNVKFTAMCLAPIIWMNQFKRFSKVFFLGSLFLITILLSVMHNPDSLRWSTVGYKAAFIVMFIMYYDLIHIKHALRITDFIKILKTLILAYTVCLLIQQIIIVIGIREFPLINLMGYLNRGIGSNSLALEPSHAARILTAVMLVLLRMHAITSGKNKLVLKRFYKDNKWVVLGFLWCMLTMGSATAFVGLAILAFYFIKKQYAVVMAPLLIVFYFAIPYIDYEPFNRTKAAFEVSLTMDREAIINEDYSAAARIVPMLNTLQHLDVSKRETWFGEGVDSSLNADYLSEKQTIGGITDYGLLVYVCSLMFVFTCCINRFFSLETLVFVLLLGASISNIAYTWGILMLFTTSTYFTTNKRFHQQRIILKTVKLV
jgi:hypothetical protein